MPNPCHWGPDGPYVAHQHPIQLMAAMPGTVPFTTDFDYYPSHCPLQAGQFLPPPPTPFYSMSHSHPRAPASLISYDA